MGNLEQVYIDGVHKETRRYLPGAIQTQYIATGAIKTQYLHKDHLGSVDTITDVNGKILDKVYFDAWGKRHSIDSSQWTTGAAQMAAATLKSVNDITNRGFTGHEHIEHADIIHMNGRIYDPTLGRFLQADPHIQAPKNSQNLNRYSYVLNNPLSLVDPSGYFSLNPFKNLKKVLKAIASVPILNMAVHVVLNIIPGCQGWCSAVYAAASTYAVTGSLKAAFTAGIVSAIMPGGESLTSIVTSGIIGGLASKIQGGNLGHGFWPAGLGAALGGRIKTGNAYANVAIAAVIGGTISKLTGGKFANGAQTWAFSAAMAQDWSGARARQKGSGNDVATTENIELTEQDKKAIEALDNINAKSIKDNKEYGGYIYKLDGEYSYTVQNDGTGASLSLDASLVPDGAIIVGDYHTHGDYSSYNYETNTVIGTGNKATDVFNSDNFSTGKGGDILGIRASAPAGGIYRGYLGTPSGVYKAYNPYTDSQYIIKR